MATKESSRTPGLGRRPHLVVAQKLRAPIINTGGKCGLASTSRCLVDQSEKPKTRLAKEWTWFPARLTMIEDEPVRERKKSRNDYCKRLAFRTQIIYTREAWRLQTLIHKLLSHRRRPEGRNIYLLIMRPIRERCVACKQKQYFAQIVGASCIVTSR